MPDSLVVSFIYVLHTKLASEISRALQPASMGNRLTLILVGAAIILSVAVLNWVFLLSKSQPKRRRMAGSNSVMEDFPS